ncbi:MAG: hypothetical protein IJ963_05470 [Phascolarctobacterium sp.]|nr:hypothetical protein [Phascolarctobacterium sp.]
MAVVDDKRKWLEFVKSLQSLDDACVTVGVQADGKKTKDGKMDMARLAAVHEFGATIIQPPRAIITYRRIRKDGSFARNGRFVKRRSANFMQTHYGMSSTIVIPERSFIRSAFDENEEKIGDIAWTAGEAVVKGALTSDNALKLVGQEVQGMVQRKIDTGPFVPNSPATIRRKGSSKPLIDSGRLRQSIRYSMRKGWKNRNE